MRPTAADSGLTCTCKCRHSAFCPLPSALVSPGGALDRRRTPGGGECDGCDGRLDLRWTDVARLAERSARGRTALQVLQLHAFCHLLQRRRWSDGMTERLLVVAYRVQPGLRIHRGSLGSAARLQPRIVLAPLSLSLLGAARVKSV